MANYFVDSGTMATQGFSESTNTYQATNMDFYVQQGQQHAGYYQPPQQQQQPNDQNQMIDPRLSQEQPMGRFLSEPEKHYLGNHLQGARESAAYLLSPSTVRHSSPYRHGSPFSQHFSGASSGALSPPAESDRFHEGTQGPSTPPDLASPYLGQMSYEHVDNSGAQYGLTGLTENGCVSMAQVNPTNAEASMVVPEQASIMMDVAVGSLASHNGSSPAPADASFFMPQHNTFDMPHSYTYGNSPHVSLPTTPSFSGFETDGRQVSQTPPLSAPLQRPSASPSTSHLKPPTEPPSNTRRRRRSSATSRRNRPFKHTSSSAPSPPKSRGLSTSTAGTRSCDRCSKGGLTEASLQKHIRTEHIRPFTCYFEYAGCTSTFAAKNEWKRHVISQHLALNYWICTDGECGKATGPSTHKRPNSLPMLGCIFNRKDLYTQHVRRMHAPAEVKSALKDKKSSGTSEWNDKLAMMQQAAQRVRCELPTHMACPVDGCLHEFTGNAAWDDRMEHVARHLEAASAGEEPRVVFGRDSDPTLTRWAESPEVAVVQRSLTSPTGWELCNPIKGDNGHRRTSCELSNEDAEGEEQ